MCSLSLILWESNKWIGSQHHVRREYYCVVLMFYSIHLPFLIKIRSMIFVRCAHNWLCICAFLWMLMDGYVFKRTHALCSHSIPLQFEQFMVGMCKMYHIMHQWTSNDKYVFWESIVNGFSASFSTVYEMVWLYEQKIFLYIFLCAR